MFDDVPLLKRNYKQRLGQPKKAARKTGLMGRCWKCNSIGRSYHGHHIIYDPPWMAQLCVKCHGNITSVNSCAGLKNKAKLTNAQRIWLWLWFMKTAYFTKHRRFSPGRARRLLKRMVETKGRERSIGARVPVSKIPSLPSKKGKCGVLMSAPSDTPAPTISPANLAVGL